MSQDLTATQIRAHQLAQQRPVIVANGNHLVAQAVEQVKATSAVAMRDVLTQLPSMVDSYQCPFDPNDLGPYRAGLYSYFDQQLSAELEKIASSSLTQVYEATQGNLLGWYVTCMSELCIVCCSVQCREVSATAAVVQCRPLSTHSDGPCTAGQLPPSLC